MEYGLYEVRRFHKTIGAFDTFKALQNFLVERFPENAFYYERCVIVGDARGDYGYYKDAHSLFDCVSMTEDCCIRHVYLHDNGRQLGYVGEYNGTR